MQIVRAFRIAATGSLGFVGVLITGLGGAALHLWTVLLLFEHNGFIAAFIAFAFPVLAELVLFINLWRNLGFMNYYTFAVGAYALGWVLLLAVVAIMEKD